MDNYKAVEVKTI